MKRLEHGGALSQTVPRRQSQARLRLWTPRGRALFKRSSSRCRSLTKRRRSGPSPPGGTLPPTTSLTPLTCPPFDDAADG